MTTLALIHPSNLVAKELRETLERRPELWDRIVQLTTDPDEAGTLTELGGSAALVALADADALAGADAVLLCGYRESDRELLEAAPAGATSILIHTERGRGEAAEASEPTGAVPVVAGVNPDLAIPGSVLASPHPGTVLLAHLLHPLRRFGPAGGSAVLVQPASFFDDRGLEELFGQARNIVAMRSQDEPSIFGRQLAFNLLPTPVAGPAISRELRTVLGGGEAELPLAVRVIQGGVFHGVSAALHLRFDGDVSPEAVREALGEHPVNRLAEESELLGPIDAAASDEVLVGGVEAVAAADGGGVWIWGVMDNLTRGGALNAVGILEALSANRPN